ncbi:MAG: hypothetical protein ACI80V_003083 [Rhodothermales bacterium]
MAGRPWVRYVCVLVKWPKSEPEGSDILGPSEPAVFTLTLTNAGESQEQRDYVLQTDHTSNPGGAILTAQGAPIHGGLTFTLGAQQSQEVTLAVSRGPNVYSYDDITVTLAPTEDETEALAASVSFDIGYTAPCSDIAITRPSSGWALNAITILESLDVLLGEFVLPISEADTVSAIGLQYHRLGDGDDLGDQWLNEALRIPVTPFQYEVRAFTECKKGESIRRVYSDAVPGYVDTAAPQVFGLPEPGDRVTAYSRSATK